MGSNFLTESINQNMSRFNFIMAFYDLMTLLFSYLNSMAKLFAGDLKEEYHVEYHVDTV